MGCIDSQPEPVRLALPAPAPARRQKTPTPKPNRLLTSTKPDQIRQISDQQRKGGFKPVYTCPICTLRFNKILACDNCNNCICHSCYLTYEKKARKSFKCAFCASQSSMFRDYQLQAHSYFDTTGNGKGFLSAQERKEVDQELQRGKGQGSVLQAIQEVQAG